jgi:hypothetical protein
MDGTPGACPLGSQGKLLPEKELEKMTTEPKCDNCNNPISHHTEHDTYCLKVMGWTAKDLEQPDRQAAQLPTRETIREEIAA